MSWLSNMGGSLLPPVLRTMGYVQVCLTLPSLLSVEISDAGLRPILLEQQRKVPSVVWHASADSSAEPTAPGEVPFQHVAGRPSSQKRRRLVLCREQPGLPVVVVGGIPVVVFLWRSLTSPSQSHFPACYLLPTEGASGNGVVGPVSTP